jgi:hypothetical protein
LAHLFIYDPKRVMLARVGVGRWVVLYLAVDIEPLWTIEFGARHQLPACQPNLELQIFPVLLNINKYLARK